MDERRKRLATVGLLKSDVQLNLGQLEASRKSLKEARRWEEADAYKNEIKAGLKIANKQVAPDLLLLPVAAPEAG